MTLSKIQYSISITISVLKARIAEIHGSEIKIRNGRSLKKGDKKRSVGEKVL